MCIVVPRATTIVAFLATAVGVCASPAQQGADEIALKVRSEWTYEWDPTPDRWSTRTFKVDGPAPRETMILRVVSQKLGIVPWSQPR